MVTTPNGGCTLPGWEWYQQTRGSYSRCTGDYRWGGSEDGDTSGQIEVQIKGETPKICREDRRPKGILRRWCCIKAPTSLLPSKWTGGGWNYTRYVRWGIVQATGNRVGERGTLGVRWGIVLPKGWRHAARQGGGRIWGRGVVEDEYALGGWLDPGGGDGGTRILVAGLARLTRDDLAP